MPPPGVHPSPEMLMKLFEHLRTLQHVLIDYVPRDVYESPPTPGHPRYRWQAGTLLFTDLAGLPPSWKPVRQMVWMVRNYCCEC
jgi:adenylate cyclase